jgi:hypothetical protein
MIGSLTLAPEVDARVQKEAAKRSLPTEEYVAHVLTAEAPQEGETHRRSRMLAAIEAVAEMGRAEEQHETFEYLARGIDEDRMSDRKLYS